MYKGITDQAEIDVSDFEVGDSVDATLDPNHLRVKGKEGMTFSFYSGDKATRITRDS